MTHEDMKPTRKEELFKTIQVLPGFYRDLDLVNHHVLGLYVRGSSMRSIHLNNVCKFFWPVKKESNFPWYHSPASIHVHSHTVSVTLCCA